MFPCATSIFIRCALLSADCKEAFLSPLSSPELTGDGTGVRTHGQLMNMCVLSVSMPSCVNPAVHDARETAGASTPGWLFHIIHGSSRLLSGTRTNITVFIHPGAVDIGYF